jgi:hypothetical protein
MRKKTHQIKKKYIEEKDSSKAVNFTNPSNAIWDQDLKIFF